MSPLHLFTLSCVAATALWVLVMPLVMLIMIVIRQPFFKKLFSRTPAPSAQSASLTQTGTTSTGSEFKDNVLFYFKAKGEEKGPFTFGQLRSMWNNGQITADALYRTSDSSECLPLAERFAASEPTSVAPQKKRHSRPAIGVAMLVGGVCLCLLYAFGHHGGTDSATGTGSSAADAANDARCQLDRLYKSYDVVDESTERTGLETSGGTHQFGQWSPINGSENPIHFKETWRCIMRVKNAVRQSN